MSYPIVKKWVPGLPKLAYRKGKPEGVLGHSTATPEATAQREYDYFVKNWRKREAFVHYFVDWIEILETADPTFKCWGAGPTANQRFVQIELCETKDPVKFKESYKRYLWLIAHLIVKHKFNPDHKKGLWTHFDATHTFNDTNHVDPFLYLEKWGIGINQFLDDVENAVKEMRNPPVVKEAVKVCKEEPKKQVKVVIETNDVNAKKIAADFKNRGYKVTIE